MVDVFFPCQVYAKRARHLDEDLLEGRLVLLEPLGEALHGAVVVNRVQRLEADVGQGDVDGFCHAVLEHPLIWCL